MVGFDNNWSKAYLLESQKKFAVLNFVCVVLKWWKLLKRFILYKNAIKSSPTHIKTGNGLNLSTLTFLCFNNEEEKNKIYLL